MNELFADILFMKKDQPKQAPTLDSAEAPARATFDGADYVVADLSLSAAAAVQQWAETDDLDAGETYADRLLALLVGVVDANKDGEFSDEEQEAFDVVVNAAYDYLVSLGVDEADAEALLTDFEEDAGDRIRELVATSLPEGEEAAADEIDAFVFGGEDQEPALDSATYKKVLAVRNGKRVKINKRIAGVVRLSSKQKLAIRKARVKSHSAAAMVKRAKSMRVRARMIKK